MYTYIYIYIYIHTYAYMYVLITSCYIIVYDVIYNYITSYHIMSASVRRRDLLARARGLRALEADLWGFDYNVTNYHINKTLNFKQSIGFHPSGLLWVARLVYSYLSDTASFVFYGITCLTRLIAFALRPRSFYALFIESRITINCKHIHHFGRKPALDK